MPRFRLQTIGGNLYYILEEREIDQRVLRVGGNNICSHMIFTLPPTSEIRWSDIGRNPDGAFDFLVFQQINLA